MMGKQWRPRSDAAERDILSGLLCLFKSKLIVK